MILFSIMSRNECPRPNKEYYYLKKVRYELNWMLAQGPTSLDEMWLLWNTIRIQKQRQLSEEHFMVEFEKQVKQEQLEKDLQANISEINRFFGDNIERDNNASAIEKQQLEEKLEPASVSGYSHILSQSDFDVLETTLEEYYQGYQWELNYCSVSDGLSLHTLFQRQKGKGRTFTVLEDVNGNIFGGYTNMGWKPNADNYYGDGGCFVFELQKHPVDSNANENAPLNDSQSSSNSSNKKPKKSAIPPDISRLCKYEWSREDDYFMYSNFQGLGMGGGGGNFAWYLDESLVNGTSGPCHTFRNQRSFTHLHEVGTFGCMKIELWTFADTYGGFL